MNGQQPSTPLGVQGHSNLKTRQLNHEDHPENAGKTVFHGEVLEQNPKSGMGLFGSGLLRRRKHFRVLKCGSCFSTVHHRHLQNHQHHREPQAPYM